MRWGSGRLTLPSSTGSTRLLQLVLRLPLRRMRWKHLLQSCCCGRNLPQRTNGWISCKKSGNGNGGSSPNGSAKYGISWQDLRRNGGGKTARRQASPLINKKKKKPTPGERIP